MCDHAHLHFRSPAATAAALAAIDAGHAMLVHQFAPTAVGENHQLRDDLVEWRAALAPHDRNHVIVNVEIEVDTIILFRLQAKAFTLGHAALFKHLRPLPDQRDFLLVPVFAGAGSEVFFRDQRIEIVMPQIRGNRHGFSTAFQRNDGPVFGVQRGIQRHGRAGLTFGEREGFNEGIGQHRDFIAGHVHG